MMDPEIEAMGTIAQAFSDLEQDARTRVLRWAADKFEVELPRLGNDARPDNLGGGEDADEDMIYDAGFEHFAELYDAASPTTKEEKLLVAGYWVQKIQGKVSFQSFELNKELKDLGHPVDHISEYMDANIKKRPSLMLQLKKAGKTVQARKTYKLSNEGIKAVDRMIAGTGG